MTGLGEPYNFAELAYTKVPRHQVELYTQVSSDINSECQKGQWIPFINSVDPIYRSLVNGRHYCLLYTISSRVSADTYYQNLGYQHHQAAVSFLTTLKFCIFQTPKHFESATVEEGINYNYNTFSYMNRTLNRWIRLPFNSTNTLDSYVSSTGDKYKRVDCGDLIKTRGKAYVFYCRPNKFGKCDYSYGINGAFLITAVAVRQDNRDNEWCMKIGFGPVLCTHDFDISYGDASGCGKGLVVGKPSYCYSSS